MPFGSSVQHRESDLTVRTTSAMASIISVLVNGTAADGDLALKLVDEVFSDFEQACSRFLSNSELNRFLRATQPSLLSRTLEGVLHEAYTAYLETEGRFDPRIRRSLEALGYDATFSALHPPDAVPVPEPLNERWDNPLKRGVVSLGVAQSRSLDLGGIAKGCALRAAREALREAGLHGLVSAGGDVVVTSDSGRTWPIAIEDPIPNAVDPIATVEVHGGAVMTSSVRVRQWRAGATPVHHLLDPRTGRPGGQGLASVTIIGEDPVAAEVWSKTIFLAGASAALTEAERRNLAAVIVTREGDVVVSAAATPLVTWVRPT